jgi:hypothetical protein
MTRKPNTRAIHKCVSINKACEEPVTSRSSTASAHITGIAPFSVFGNQLCQNLPCLIDPAAQRVVVHPRALLRPLAITGLESVDRNISEELEDPQSTAQGVA